MLLRGMEVNEKDILRDFLYEAIFIPEGVKPPDRSIIPKFWAEYMGQGKKCPIMGTFGVCVDMGDKDFDYWIADLYKPWKDIPEGCDTYQIPGSLWAQFICKGALPDSLQSVNTKIWSEWLPALQGYELAGKYNLEVYGPPTENPDDYISYIWIPLKKV